MVIFCTNFFIYCMKQANHGAIYVLHFKCKYDFRPYKSYIAGAVCGVEWNCRRFVLRGELVRFGVVSC